MFKRILAPVDGSATSRRGLRAAIDLAKAQRARLVILNVVDAMPVFASLEGMAAYDPGILEALRKGGKAILARAAAAAKTRGVKARTVLAENNAGRVADAIVREAKKQRADLIVIGTHGRRGLSRMVMGSDAELVVRYTPAPVLHTRFGPWRFTALYSNTYRAHELHRTHDWVVICFDDGEHGEGQQTVVTEWRGTLEGRRVVRGREAECATHYRALARLATLETS